MTITDAQKGRLWAIARDNGYSRSAVYELVKDYGFDDPEDVTREDYEEICRVAGDEQAAEEFNRKAGAYSGPHICGANAPRAHR